MQIIILKSLITLYHAFISIRMYDVQFLNILRGKDKLLVILSRMCIESVTFDLNRILGTE